MGVRHSLEVSVIIICSMLLASDVRLEVWRVCIALIVACSLMLWIRAKVSTYKLNLVDSDGMNEVILLNARVNGRSFLFMLDTGYAGPPVLSRSYLAISDPTHLNVKSRYKTILKRLLSVKEEDEHAAVNEYMNRGGCFPFTSGCTMRLMGIGSTQEQQADMLMCPMLHLENVVYGMHPPKTQTNVRADVFVTNSLKHSVHIITCDLLLHHSPCMLDLGKQRLELDMSFTRYLSVKPSFYTMSAVFSGGAYVVPIVIGSGDIIRCTVDTGSPGSICIGANAASRLQQCQATDRKSLQQNGVNGEVVCSELIEASVGFADRRYKVPILINSMPTDQVDGYIGMGFLRAFDILMTTTEIGFRLNGISMKSIGDFKSHASLRGCGRETLPCSL